MDDTQIDKLDQEIAALQAKKKALLDKSRGEALATTRASVARFGFTAQELGLSVAMVPKAKKSDEGTMKSKAPAKYANPTNPSQTWAGGQGARPHWVRDHLAAGGALDELLIKA